MKINETPKKIKQYTVEYRRKKKWMKAITCLAAVVVFCTVYALILPAIALDKDHILKCSHTVHQHNNECYNEDGVLNCGYADYVVHTHQGDYCYDENGNLVCELAEIKAHGHDVSCYEEQSTLVCQKEESRGHMHDKSCYTRVQGNLICTNEEHEHTDECYVWTEELTCGMEEGEGAHQHSAECYEPRNVLICENQDRVPHQHSADCYDEGGNLICGMLQIEEHEHTDACTVPLEAESDTTAENGENGTEASTTAEDGKDETEASTTAEDGKDETEDGIAAENSENEIPDQILKEIADKYKIYPGMTEDGKVWTAYDAASERDASIKAIVTLPKDTTVEKDHYLYIRKVEEADPYFPSEEALDKEVGRRNDVATYAIHWVHIYQDDNGKWQYNPQTTSVLGGEDFATIKIELLKDEAYIVGKQANRKLQVYNSRQEDGSKLEGASNTLVDVTATDDAYTGFTFQTNRGGPYVFASKYLFDGYVKSITIDKTTDGAAPFDGDDNAGNDSGDNNRIIRTYDNIKYSLTANFGARSNVSTETSAQMHFEMTMNADITDAVFDVSQMLWMGSNYTLEYLDEAGNVVLTQETDGKYYKDGKEISLNDIVSDSTNGEKSYTTNITQQRLKGKIDLEATDNLLASNRTFSAAVQVLNADNGSSIQPTFRAWFEGNEDNYGSENPGEGNGVILAEKVTDNEKKSDEIKVSASARFNLELKENSNMSYKGWFDSYKGKEVNSANKDTYTVGNVTVTGGQLYTLLEQLAVLDENIGRANPEEFTDNNNTCSAYLQGQELSAYKSVFENIRYGRITGYGIGIQVYNEASDNQNTSSKEFKGVSLPQGDISFDLDLEVSAKSSGGDIDAGQYYAQLWEYNENVVSSTGNQDKNMYWADLAATQYAAWAAPYNGDKKDQQDYCYTGGNWSLSDENHFTVSGYDLNFLSSGPKFPTYKAGNSSISTGYNVYIGCFSAGYVQVLNVFPRYHKGTINMGTKVTVKNLTASTIDGQSISADQSDETGYAHETNKDDNSLTDDIPLYAKGGMTKANAFCTAKLFDNQDADFTSKDYFLGTYFWGTSYDGSAFAGQQITLVGAARISAGDYQIKHMNLLQLFDSKVLSITKEKNPPYVISRIAKEKGDTTILYAADPDYKEGYDTDNRDVMDYMSTVREEDLLYYDSLEALEKDGYTCVGVMAELRNWSIPGESGYSTALKIPMDVSQEKEFLNQTVATVNTARIWTNANDMEDGTVSWKNGVYDYSTGKNSVAGYTSVNMSSDDHYCGEVANPTAYEKVKYSNGQIELGSNAGGYVYGNSLLILGYKSEVDIEVDNGGEGSLPTFDLNSSNKQDDGNNIVNYRLKDIIAKTDYIIGSTQDTKTDLTVMAKMDTPKGAEVDTDAQRITVATDSYCMEPTSERMVLTDKDGNPLSKQSVKISSHSDNQTTVYYAFTDPETGKVDPSQRYEIKVYAERDTNGTQVTFRLEGVTIGVNVPDITYDANINPNAVKNNDRINATAYISGTSDVRAYSETEGNMDTVTIGIIKLTSTRLVKLVDKSYIELDGTFTYTVTYTNSGSTPVNVYLYDLLPNTEDIRGSEFGGDVILRKINASMINDDSSGDDTFTADIDFYYSKMEYEKLYNMVKVFGGNEDGTGRDTEKVEEMLTANDGNFMVLGCINNETKHEFQSSDTLKDMANKPANNPDKYKDRLTEEMAEMTGVYGVVKNLGINRSLSIQLTVQAVGNNAGDLYRNIANSWLGDESDPLTSNRVETAVLSRTISGVVWDDSNFNGVRDDEEHLIPNVTCTLFKWNEQQKKYVVCTKDVTGAEIKPITTKKDGAYIFKKLEAGDYIVAFSGFSETETLKKYVGATTYQVNGENDGITNDAVALNKTKGEWDKEEVLITGIDNAKYNYAIAYSLNDADNNIKVNATSLHTIGEILDKNIPLTNNVELYENLDCGLVIGSYRLPETGGPGTTMYIVGGLLIISASLLLLYKNKKCRKEDSATY